MKECSRCKETKNLEEFSPQARGLFGRQSRCKICNKELARIYREKNPTSGSIAAKKWREKYPEKVKEQNKKIWANPEKRSKRQNQFKNWVEKNPDYYRKWYWKSEKSREKKKSAHKEWQKRNPKSAIENNKRQRKRNPDKVKSRDILRKAVYERKIFKPRICSMCLKEAKRIEAHHEDYEKPLDVQWLCVPCHKSKHFVRS